MHKHSVIRFWAEPNENVPGVSRFKYNEVYVDVLRAITTGLPTNEDIENSYSVYASPRSLWHGWADFVSAIVDTEAFIPGDFAAADMASMWKTPGTCNNNVSSDAPLLSWLSDIRLIDDDASYADIFEQAYACLQRCWNRKRAHKLLYASISGYPGFNELRTAIKQKDSGAKLTSYHDIAAYPLEETFSPEDFKTFDTAVLENVLGASLNFRYRSVLDEFTDKDGFFQPGKGRDRISQFGCEENTGSVHYVCNYDGAMVEMVPKDREALNASRKSRLKQQFCKEGQLHCMYVGLEELISWAAREENSHNITFPRNNYSIDAKGVIQQCSIVAVAAVPLGGRNGSTRFGAPGLQPLDTTVNADLERYCEEHGLKKSGPKHEKLTRLAEFAAAEYGKYAAEFDVLFEGMTFIRSTAVPSVWFPVRGEYPESALLRAYIFLHMRGNAIFDPAFDNDTTDCSTLLHGWLVEGREKCNPMEGRSYIPADKRTVELLARFDK